MFRRATYEAVGWIGVLSIIAIVYGALVALVQRRLRPGDGASAIASAAIALTLLPLARHGRMAMLDGTLLAAMLLVWWGVLLPPPRRSEAKPHAP